MKKSIIIIPVYNEEATLRDVALKTIEKAGELCDILFVNDGSSDKSGEILNELQRDYPAISVIHQKTNGGYGLSLITGFKYAISKEYHWILTMDCDEQHQPSDISRFLNFDPSIDIVSGSRYMASSGKSGKAPEDRVEINRRITSKLNDTYGFSITDAFCGFKRYKKDMLTNSNFEEYGYASPMELWAYASKNNFSIKELSVDRIYITDDRSFGEDLDKKRKRYKYYLKAWKKAHNKYYYAPLKLFVNYPKILRYET